MRIAFASCSNINMQKDYQPIWGIINGQQPDLLLLLGDNVYIGTGGIFDEEILEQQYKRQLAESHFNKLLCEVPYLAIWDNHDFGTNSSTFGVNVIESQKEKSRDLFYRYLKNRSAVPHSVVPGRNEIYCPYTIDDVKFIMLDVRSYQEDPATAGDDATLLGEDQENWLLNEMGNSPGITIICSGISYSYRQKGWEKYKNWFHNFNRRIGGTSKTLFLGGSIHKNYFKHHIIRGEPIVGMRNALPTRISYPPSTPLDINFYEIITSSVGRNIGGDPAEPPLNKYGIIDIKTSRVEITLYSQQADNFIHKVISRENWELVN